MRILCTITLAALLALDGLIPANASTTDNRVVGWGNNYYSQINIPSGLRSTAIATSYDHNLALKSDGSIVGWGDSRDRQLIIPYGLTGVVAIAAGDSYDLALVLVTAGNAPVANPGGPYLGAVNTSIGFDGSGSSDQDGDPLNYAWTFGDGATGSGVAPSHSYAQTGIYNVCLTVNDGALNSGESCVVAVVYDPSGGFVTGGGWIDSPLGACPPGSLCEGAAGRANFGFIAKYRKGASAPEGNTGFSFQTGGLDFQSQAYEWLVVNQAGTNAQFKGSGLINGAPDPKGNLYKFMLWAGDGDPDTFRIRIWSEENGIETVVYDNGSDQPIGAGNILVHRDK